MSISLFAERKHDNKSNEKCLSLIVILATILNLTLLRINTTFVHKFKVVFFNATVAL